MTKKNPGTPTVAGLRLTGTESEIELLLAVFRGKGFSWKSNGRFYPQREPNQYACYLHHIEWGPTESE